MSAAPGSSSGGSRRPESRLGTLMPLARLNQKIAVSVVYVAALFMAIMDSTIVNVALPTLGREFHTSTDAVDGVVIAYLVSLAVFIPTSGWLGDRLGGRRVLLGSIVLFAAASALCGTATSLGELVAFRVLQGIGGGLMTPVGMAMLWRVFPPAERVRASGLLVIPTALAPAVGPVLGGLLVTDVSWRWVFYVNVPIALAALAFGLACLHDQRLDHSGPFDPRGFLLSGAGLGLLMYGVSEGPIKGWARPQIVASCAAGAALLVIFAAIELRTRDPLLNLRLLRDRLFATSNGVMLLASVSFIGVIYLVALFYQDGLGLSALQSGLSTFPEAIGVMLGAQFTAKLLYPVLGPRRLMSAGLVVVAAGMASLLAIGDGTSLWWARLVLFVIGLGMSGVFIPTQTAAFATISNDDMGSASTLFNTQRQLGGAVGVAFLTTVLAAVGPFSHLSGHAAPNLGAYRTAFLTAVVIALLGAGLALRIHDEDAASTITRWRRRAPASGLGGRAEDA
ncbi:MAG TPA: MDR family MFS transporter, partial [Candidatus Limnocylindria bacterium]|nr:MDR family MFS transporter [Candidatus Limnocylindria bacterium]